MACNLFFKHPVLLDVFILFVSFSQNAWGVFFLFLHLSQCFCCLLKFLIVFKGVCPIQRVCKERRVPSQECLRVWVGGVVDEGDGRETILREKKTRLASVMF